MNARKENVTVVLDDDPTGIQTVHSVKLYTFEGQDLFIDAFIEGGLFYIWTNTRSLGKDEMLKRNNIVMDKLIHASKITGRDFTIISRSDSTLRGHYPEEPLILKKKYEEAGNPLFDGEVLFFYFAEGGRFTKNDIHYVRTEGKLIPASETEFAKDRNFGYISSDLKEYIEEKTSGKVKACDVLSISIDMLRNQGVEGVSDFLKDISGYQRIVVNAMEDKDAEIAAKAFKTLERSGKKFLYRTAASFVSAYGSITKKDYLNSTDLNDPKKILVVAGSYVRKTTLQLEYLLKDPKTRLIEIDISKVIISKNIDTVLAQSLAYRIDDCFEKGITPVLATSRNRPEGLDNDEFLEAGTRISSFLTEVIKNIRTYPDVIVSKGGITSNDIVEKSMGVKSALVLGQIIPGVPVIRPVKQTGPFCVPVVIFPGNVGEERDLEKVYQILRR